MNNQSRPVSYLASKHTPQDAAALLLLLVATRQTLGDGPKSQSLENTVQSERAQKPIHKPTQPQPAQEFPD